MSHIAYNFPAMLEHTQDMERVCALLEQHGESVAQEQRSLSSSWSGETGEYYQAWQQRWSQQYHELINAYRNMIHVYHNNTMNMVTVEHSLGTAWT